MKKLLRYFPFFQRKDPYLGTLSGVYLPNILQMLGVILFLRLGWITGHMGLPWMLLIMTMCSSILFITGLSMTSIVTNLKMGGGGSYYLISRCLGVEFGSALGILLGCAQITSIALCVSGFVVSLQQFFPYLSSTILEIATIFILSILSYISTNLAIRVQIGIFITLTISLISVFMGKAENIPSTIQPLPQIETLSFWMTFAMFFPATTGIEAGMSLSGDLRNPSRSLPIGTILAIITVYFLYTSLAIFLDTQVGSELLKSHPMIIYHLASSGTLVILGIWAATLSSALGGILGTPRTLQAIANDGILPKFLAKGYGPTKEPRTATVFVFLLASLVTAFTDINQLIPILTMICLTSYGLINFISFFESLVQNPSWRPTFKTPWILSLVGCLACAISMLMINAGASLIVLFLLIALSFWTSKKKLQANWFDMRYSLFASLARFATNQLSYLQMNPRTWRPNLLAIVDPKLKQKNLIFFAHSLNHGKGFLTYGTTVFSQDVPKVNEQFSQFFSLQKIPSFQTINVSHDPFYGLESLTRNYGLGPLQPNTILLPFSEPSLSQVNSIVSIYSQEKNVLLLKTKQVETDLFLHSSSKRSKKKLHLWWGGKYPANFELSLALAFLLQNSKIWARATIQINTFVRDEQEKKERETEFQNYKELLRSNHITFSIHKAAEDDFYKDLLYYSKEADLTFLGLKPPKKDPQNLTEYTDYYQKIMEKTAPIENVVYILAGEDLAFEKIFL